MLRLFYLLYEIFSECHVAVAESTSSRRRRLELEEDFYKPVPPPATSCAKSKADFLSSLRDFQWSHGLPEKTIGDMLNMMKQGDVRDYIRSDKKLPAKHTEADKFLQAEVN